MTTLRWLTAGESHGPALVAIIEGLPAGLALTTQQVQHALARRRLGYGRGARMSFEQDVVRVVAGLRHGRTLGSPLAIEIANSEWPKWQAVMAADPVPPTELLRDAGTGDAREVARNRPLTRPRPGHADLSGMQKYNLRDARDVLERASARETAARVALGAAAKALLQQVAEVRVVSHVTSIGSEVAPARSEDQLAELGEALDADPVRCADPAASAAMVAQIDQARAAGDTLGGTFEVLAYGVPPGLGSYVSPDRRLDARLAAAIMGVPAIKGVEIGDGFQSTKRPGSLAHDEILRSAAGALVRATNRAGGIEGGMSNGEVVRVRAAMKPISTVPRPLRTIDVETGAAAEANHQRSDVCAVPAAAVVAEAELALVLATALVEKVGGDSVPEQRRNLCGFLDAVAGLAS